MTKECDVLIIGAGPAGLTAGIYSGRAGLRTLILEKTAAGGQILKADIVENYPAFPDGISGFELMEKMKNQAEKFGVEFISVEARELRAHSSKLIVVHTNEAATYSAKAVILATGANPKALGIKGEAELTGRGVSYCATCVGPIFRDKEVVVVGGGDSAVGEALYLTRFVKKLTLIHRRDALRAAKILQEKLVKNDRVEIRWDSVPEEILGGPRVSGIKIKNVKTGKEEHISCDGIFIYVGVEPNTYFLKDKIKLDGKKFVVTNENMETSQKGVFACGDGRKNALKQVVTACAEGALAAYSCLRYIEESEGNRK